MSVEFHALEEQTTAGGIREIRRAFVPDVALVDDPEYGQTAAELRQRGWFGSFLSFGLGMSCDCCEGDADEIWFEEQPTVNAFTYMIEQIRAGRNVSAISERAGDVVATTATGTLTLELDEVRQRRGRTGLRIRMDPLDTEAGRNTRELIGAGVEVFARPLLNWDQSEWEIVDRTARVSRAVFDYILVKPTHRADGIEALAVSSESRDRKGRGAVETFIASEAISERSRRRRLWL